MDEQLVEVVVSAEDADWLAGFTRSLVEDRLAACGHVQPGVRALYRWAGQLHDDAATRQTLDMEASNRGDRPPARTTRGLA